MANGNIMMHRTKVKRRFVLARNRRIDLDPLGYEEVAKLLGIRHFSGFRVFGGLRGAVRPVDGAACQWHAFSTDRVGRRDRLAPTEAERRREAAEQSVCISLGQRLLSEASYYILKVVK